MVVCYFLFSDGRLEADISSLHFRTPALQTPMSHSVQSLIRTGTSL